MNKTVFVEATYEVVSTIKGQKMADKQTVMIEVDISKLVDPYSLDGYRQVFFAVVDTGVKMKACEAFIQRLKTETALKRKVGGTKWSIQLVGGIEAQPLYQKAAKIGDFKQFIRGKKVSDWNEELKKQVSKIIFPNIVGQITDRNYAIVKQLYEQAVKAPAANDAKIVGVGNKVVITGTTEEQTVSALNVLQDAQVEAEKKAA